MIPRWLLAVPLVLFLGWLAWWLYRARHAEGRPRDGDRQLLEALDAGDRDLAAACLVIGLVFLLLIVAGWNS